jgi:hypothetical protein
VRGAKLYTLTLMARLEDHVACSLPLIEALCNALRREARSLFSSTHVLIGSPTAARYRIEHDPAEDTESLVGEWFDDHGQRVGMVVCHAGGQGFAEHDIVRAHPHDPRWFVEAVEAWGRAEPETEGGGIQVNAEVRMLPKV